MVVWVFFLLKRSIKLCWESGYGGWGIQAKASGGGFYCVNISWVMEVGVFQNMITWFQAYGGLLFLFKMILLLGFAKGFIMVIVLNFAMMNGVGGLFCKINSQTYFWWVKGKRLLLLKIFSGSGGGVIWSFSFQRNRTDFEISDFVVLLGILDKVCVSVGKDDERIWKPAVKGQFLVKSFYNVLADRSD